VPGSIFADCCSAAVAWDRRRQIALRLPVDHGRSNPSTLTRYRARLLLHGRERLALENSLALAAEPGNSPPRRSRSSFDPAEGAAREAAAAQRAKTRSAA
jgi:hypothetical protein